STLPGIAFSGLKTFAIDTATANYINTIFDTFFLHGAQNYRGLNYSLGTRLIVEGNEDVNDSFTISDPADSDSVAVRDNLSGVTVRLDGSGAQASVTVLGRGGNDSLTVDSTGGALVMPITYDGGTGADTLTLTGGTATSDTYTPGPTPGSGNSTLVIGGLTETVNFTNLEPVIDLVGGPLTVNGT